MSELDDDDQHGANDLGDLKKEIEVMESDTKERKMGTIESRKSIKGAWKIVSLGAMYVCHPFSLTIPLIYTNYAARVPNLNSLA